VADPLILFVQAPGLEVDAGPTLGIEGLIDYMRDHLKSWSAITMEAEDITDTGDGTIMATVRQHAVGRGSGAETDLRYYQLWSFRGGKLIRLENFRERAEALEAVGLSE
jgi:ketosteroid isomerase-like protein